MEDQATPDAAPNATAAGALVAETPAADTFENGAATTPNASPLTRSRRRRTLWMATALVVIAAVAFVRSLPTAWSMSAPGWPNAMTHDRSELLFVEFDANQAPVVDEVDGTAHARMHRYDMASGEPLGASYTYELRPRQTPRGVLEDGHCGFFDEAGDGRLLLRVGNWSQAEMSAADGAVTDWAFFAPSWDELDQMTPLPEIGDGTIRAMGWNADETLALVVTESPADPTPPKSETEDSEAAQTDASDEDATDANAPKIYRSVGTNGKLVPVVVPKRGDSPKTIEVIAVDPLSGQVASRRKTTVFADAYGSEHDDYYSFLPDRRTLVVSRMVSSLDVAVAADGTRPVKEFALIDCDNGTLFESSLRGDGRYNSSAFTTDGRMAIQFFTTAGRIHPQSVDLRTGKTFPVQGWPNLVDGGATKYAVGQIFYVSNRVDFETGLFGLPYQETSDWPGKYSTEESRLLIGHFQQTGQADGMQLELDWFEDHSLGKRRKIWNRWTLGEAPSGLVHLWPGGRLTPSLSSEDGATLSMLDLPKLYEAATGQPPQGIAWPH